MQILAGSYNVICKLDSDLTFAQQTDSKYEYLVYDTLPQKQNVVLFHI